MKTLKSSSPYLVLLLPLIYFAIFLHLDTLPFRVWDESFLSMHTWMMMHDHDYLVVHNYSGPEMSNTKPPLAIWCMVTTSRLIGYSELAIRLPNAISGVIICLVLFFFFARRYQSPVTGFGAVMVVLSSTALIRSHVLRTGEYDGVLLLFVCIFCIAYFLLLEPDSAGRRKAWLWVVFSISVICAVWTKGIAPMMMPALAVYTLTQKKLLWLLRSKELYICAAAIIFFGLGYYLLREHYNPGYLKAVWENELGGRYITTSEGHKGPIWCYLSDLITIEVSWLPFFIIGILGVIMDKENPYRRLVTFSTIVLFVFLLIISLGATKLLWYDAPIMPFFAMVSGVGISIVSNTIFRTSILNQTGTNAGLATVFICLLATPGYMTVIDNDQAKLIDKDHMTYYLKSRNDMNVNMNGYKILYDNPYTARVFHSQLNELESKGQIIQQSTLKWLKAGDIVITGSASDRDSLNGWLTHQRLDDFRNIETWKLLEAK